MGLGLNGGGLASARYLAERGAAVTVTDLKTAAELEPSIRSLDGLGVRFVLGRHDEADFSGADLVVKNPAVRPDNAFLRLARRVETDLSLFLRGCPAPVAAVTGSKGKSTTASALAWMIARGGATAHLGGNITVSPLSFAASVKPGDVVVLELSSWQLGDLKGMGVLKPKVAVITRIVPDHLDRYGTMDAYVADKRLIYADQGASDWLVYDLDDGYGPSFASEARSRPLGYGTALPEGLSGAAVPGPKSASIARLPGTGSVELVPERLLVPGGHARRNLAAAALGAWALGIAPDAIREASGSFAGIEHRLEAVRTRRGVRWYNDSAATVPEAVAAAVAAFDEPVTLISGGTDKKLDYRSALGAYKACSALVLLSGSGTEILRPMLDAEGVGYSGPFGSMREAVDAAASMAKPGGVAVLSPGCTSFGMFKNEFDRGRSFKAAVAALPD